MIRIITILFLFLSTGAGAQHGMLLAKPAAGGGTTYLLDTYTGAAAAYAVHKLKSDADSCMVIRRSSDNATQLIGFSGDDIDEATITSHCSGTDCFVVRWCDQTGQGRDAIQTTAASQPKIVSSGTIITLNSILCLDYSFTTSGVRLQTNAFSSALSQPITVFSAFYSSTAAAQAMFDGRSNQVALSRAAVTAKYELSAGATIAESSASAAGDYVSTSLFNSTSSQFWLNTTSAASGDAGSNTMDGVSVGNLRGVPSPVVSSYQLDGQIQLLVIYPSDQSANRTGIESIINTYYSIY